MTKQNSITLYLPEEDEKQVELASKQVSLSKASFCRTLAVQKAREILGENSKQEDYA